MAKAESGGIFVSYRRQETSHLAGRLYDRLADRFGDGQVFIDVDTIEPGVDFAEEISRAVATCKVLLAVIGPSWLTAGDEQGHRRLDDPDDIVRLEIEAALARDVRVIPILVEGAAIPGRQDLPESLAGLTRRNALFIRHESFRSDVGRLVTAIERVLAAPGIVARPTAAAIAEKRPLTSLEGKLQSAGPEVMAVADCLRVLGEETGLSIVSVPASLRLCDRLGAVVLLYPTYRSLEFPLDRLWEAGRDAEIGEVRDTLQQIAGNSRPVAKKSPNIACVQALSHWEAVTEIVRTLARMRAESTAESLTKSKPREHGP
jgi:TIR domain